MKSKMIFIYLIMILAVGCFCSVASALEVGGVNIHGWASQGFVQTPKENPWPVKGAGQGSFQFNDYAINASMQLTENLHAGFQLFGQERGYYGNDKVQLDWAYVDYRAFDWLGIRGGKVKMPQGLYNETRDNDMLRTFIFLPQGIYNDIRRDAFSSMLGGAFYGTVPAGKVGSFAYLAEVGEILIPDDSGMTAQLKAMGLVSSVSDYSTSTTYAAKIDWSTPLDGLRIVGTASFIPTLTATGTVPLNFPIPAYAGTSQSGTMKDWGRYVAAAEYTWKDLVLAVEYEKIRVTTQAFIGPASHAKPESYYLSATYRFTDFFELGGYYSTYYADEDNHHKASPGFPDYNAWQKDLALTTRFDINDYIVFKCEGHYLNGTNSLNDVISSAQVKQAREDWFMFATKLTVGF